MRWPVVLVFVAVVMSREAAAQDRFGIGASLTYVAPVDERLTDGSARVVPIIRLEPGRGWGISGAFNWFATEVDGSLADLRGPLGELQVRPLMVGVGYTLQHGRVRTTISLVAGPAWNRLKVREEARAALAALDRDVADTLDVASLAVRPGLGVSVRVAPRLDVTGFGGYLFNRPTFTELRRAGDVPNGWIADAVVLSTGVVVSLF